MTASIRMAAAGTRAQLFMRSLLGIGAILVDYFKGAIHVARFTRRALPASVLYARHVESLQLDDVELTTRDPDARPELMTDDAVVTRR